MTTTKDKLSASVRQAKSAQKPEAEAPPASDSQDSTDKASSSAKKPARAKPPAKAESETRKAPTGSQKKSPATTGRGKPEAAEEVPESGTELFPKRVWPD